MYINYTTTSSINYTKQYLLTIQQCVLTITTTMFINYTTTISIKCTTVSFNYTTTMSINYTTVSINNNIY